MSEEFLPPLVFAPEGDGQPVPRILIAPPRYIQGAGVLEGIGRYLSLLPARRPGVLASRRGHGAEAAAVVKSLEQHGLESATALFTGECSLKAIDAAVAELRDARVDAVIAVGGGKCVDAGKCVAARLQVPVVIVPTLASNDAPCSALSVIYSEEGVTEGVEFFPANPALVVVDTAVVAAAAERYLAAGMGDAMATWYEARVCYDNPAGRNMTGGRPTLASCAIGETCAHTLYADGVAAANAVRQGQVDEALERVVEANTLLSGVGFESGGLAAAHSIAQGYTNVPVVERNYLHGEMVAMGVLTQLMMQGDATEARRAAGFFAAVGLPVNLAQVGLTPDSPDLDALVDGALGFAFIHNMPGAVDAGVVHRAVIDADRLGSEVQSRLGDEAYRRLQA